MRTLLKKLLLRFCGLINRFPLNNKLRLRGTELRFRETLMFSSRVECRGRGNVISAESGATLQNCLIHISGNDNRIIIGKNAHLSSSELWIEDSGNVISIGEGANLCGKAHLACIEGTKIEIGKNCLFSSEIVFRTGDSHSILDENGVRTNASEDIVVSDHVWIGHRAIVSKGAYIPSDSIVATGAIVTKKFDTPNVVLAGAPAKVIKENINWESARVPVGEKVVKE